MCHTTARRKPLTRTRRPDRISFAIVRGHPACSGRNAAADSMQGSKPSAPEFREHSLDHACGDDIAAASVYARMLRQTLWRRKLRIRLLPARRVLAQTRFDVQAGEPLKSAPRLYCAALRALV